MDWMILPYRRYFDFSGRSRRREYWMFALLGVIVAGFSLALMFAGGLNAAALTAVDGPLAFSALSFDASAWFGVAVLFGFGLASFIPAIAVVVRRLHDRDLSGWWYLGVVLVGAIPVVGALANLAFLVLMCLPGTPGPNRFGPDPKAGQGASFG